MNQVYNNREIWRAVRDDLKHRRPLKTLEAYREGASEAYGYVLSTADGIAKVSGLPKVKLGETIRFEGDQYGIAMNLEEDALGVMLLTAGELKSGAYGVGTGETIDAPTGDAVLGRVLDPLGRPLDGGAPLPEDAPRRPLEMAAPSIMERAPVNRPVETGITAIDAMIPIGRGQRELIIGDRQTGKTTIAVDTILNQRGQNMRCFYVAIGQKMSTIATLYDRLKQNGALAYTTIVAASASATAGMQYLAPYAGCTMAEAAMRQGHDCLIVYDDLTKHAHAYRAISLLLRRPPGREAFPGDVFYIHSRLLERAAKLNAEAGGGSLTALPIVETQDGDISAYIPTNIISITDGQIFLESDLFFSGQRPAINVGLSVSRVGGDAQTRAMRKVAGKLRVELAQYREKKAFSQFGADLDDATRHQLAVGGQLTGLLRQGPGQARRFVESILLLELGAQGAFDGLDPARLIDVAATLLAYVREHEPHLYDAVQANDAIDDDFRQRALAVWQRVKATLDDDVFTHDDKLKGKPKDETKAALQTESDVNKSETLSVKTDSH